MGEEYEDLNGDGKWTSGEEYEDLNGDGKWTSGEEYEDLNGDGKWTSGEEYEDLNSDGEWTDAEPFEDLNRDGLWSTIEKEKSSKEPDKTVILPLPESKDIKSEDKRGAKFTSVVIIMERILYNLLEMKTIRGDIIAEVESEEIQNMNDKFNVGFSISNIGPKIDFVDVDQADPSPTNMRVGIFAQLYNDGYNKVNFLFDANKLLVTRYQMMDWDGDGIVGGYDEFGEIVSNDGIILGDYNSDRKKEYDGKKYFDDPWYLAIFTAWLDDWYFGGDFDYSSDGTYDRKIGGYNCLGGELIEKSLEEFECEGGEWVETNDLEFTNP
jgi:hypothetical protein